MIEDPVFAKIFPMEGCIQLSLAISLKRIADALTDKALAETLTTAIFNGVNDGMFSGGRK